ncbi:MAG TPA: M67 family metallopeptidase [Solirubrobacteraceae bacterium]|nr:M67 family metallopeptidase [Solirubrobacteraceae bacterium]
MRIGRAMIDEMVAHAREEAPNECCGLVASSNGDAQRVYRAANAERSPVKYVVDPRDQIRIQNEIDDHGWELGAIYHSHTRTEPFPSQTDINLARNWPDPLYVIVGVAGEPPDVRAFRIVDGQVSETELEVR